VTGWTRGSGARAAWKVDRSASLEAFLCGQTDRFSFDSDSIPFPRTPPSGNDLPSAFKLGAKLSRRYLSLLRDLHIAFGELYDREDERFLNLREWLPLERNMVLDLGIPAEGYASASPGERLDHARKVYLADYDAQRHPYITHAGHAIPVCYLSWYLKEPGHAFPAQLQPGRELDRLLASRKSIIGTEPFARSKDSDRVRTFLQQHRGRAISTDPPNAGGEPPRAMADLLTALRPWLDCLSRLETGMLREEALQGRIPETSRNEALLSALKAWDLATPFPLPEASVPLYQELLAKCPFSTVFRQEWLPVVETFRWLERLLYEWAWRRRWAFYKRRRLAESYSRVAESLGDALDGRGEARDAEERSEISALEAFLSPARLLRLFTEASVPNDELGPMLTRAFAVIKALRCDPAALCAALRSEKVRGELYQRLDVTDPLPELAAFLADCARFPAGFRALDALEGQVLGICQGKIEFKREINFNQLLTHLLVPSHDWLKGEIIPALESQKSRNPEEALHALFDDWVVGKVLGEAELDSAEASRIRASLRSLPQRAGECVTGLLSTLPDAGDARALGLFVGRRYLRLAELILKCYRRGPETFISRALEQVGQLMPDWSYKPHKNFSEDHFFRSVPGGRFEELRLALENFNRGDLFEELRDQWHRVSVQTRQETERLAARLAAEGKLSGLAEQQRFLDERRRLEKERRDKVYADLLAADEVSNGGSTRLTTFHQLMREVRRYMEPQVCWSAQRYELLSMRRFRIDALPRIQALRFEIGAQRVNRVRFAHRFEEKEVKDPQAMKHVWPRNPCAYLSGKEDLPDLDPAGAGKRTLLERRERYPIHTPENLKCVLELVEICFPDLFTLSRGARPQFPEAERRYDQSPLTVLITPPGVRPMKELPAIPRYFSRLRGRSLGNLCRTAFHAREWGEDPDAIYSGAYFDPRHQTLVISADADDTNLFHYILEPEAWRSRQVFSSILMALGMMVYHRLPEWYRQGDYGDPTRSWRTCLQFSRAAERRLYLDSLEKMDREEAAQCSGMNYNVPVDKMAFDYYVMEIEFASYFSEIMLELLSGKRRNLSRPGVVNAYFHEQVRLTPLPLVHRRRNGGVTDAPELVRYGERFREVQARVRRFLKLPT